MKGQTADPEKLLDSYTEEVGLLLESLLITANPDHSEHSWIDAKSPQFHGRRGILVFLLHVPRILHGP